MPGPDLGLVGGAAALLVLGAWLFGSLKGTDEAGL